MKIITYFIALLLALSLVQDADAKIKRSAKARREFKKENPCPTTGKSRGSCPGYDIDHIIPLSRGGPDHPTNMQWLRIDEHREKTRKERLQERVVGNGH